MRGFNRRGHTRGAARARVDGGFPKLFLRRVRFGVSDPIAQLAVYVFESHEHICRIVRSLFDPSRSERHFDL